MIFLKEYFIFFYYFLFCFTVAICMILLARYLGPIRYDNEKLSVYECGFEPFTNSRIQFDVTFFLIALLYLIFDLEIVLLLPWIIFAAQLGFFSYVIILFVLIILLLGFVIEWFRGALDWVFQRV